MARQKKLAVEIPAEALKLDVMPAEGVLAGDFLPPDGTETELPAAAATAVDESARIASQPSALDHTDIGNWVAIHWRSRPMWRHKRTGQTLHKRDEVRRLRNLK